MNYKLHYAQKNFSGFIEEFDYKVFEDIQLKVDKILTKDDRETVFLFTHQFSENTNNDDNVIISANRDHIMEYVLDKHWFTKLESDSFFWLYEFASYESAYRVARDMKEISPLCYDKPKGDSATDD